LCRDEVRKAKTGMQQNLARNAKNVKKGFYRHARQKKKIKKSIPSLLSKTGKQVTVDEEEIEKFLPIKSLNHRMVRVGRDHKDHLIPTPLSWHWQSLFLHLSSGWTTRGLGEHSPSQSKGRSRSGPPEEPEHM